MSWRATTQPLIDWTYLSPGISTAAIPHDRIVVQGVRQRFEICGLSTVTEEPRCHRCGAILPRHHTPCPATKIESC